MSKDREIACIYYACEGECLKGKEGTFRKACQICKKYQPRKGSVPAKKNLKRQKLEKIKEFDIKAMMKNY